MKVLVSDTSVVIDLERSAMVEEVFKLRCEFAVPDLLFKRELATHHGKKLRNLGLRIESMDKAGLQRAHQYFKANKSLSLPDCFALSIAKENSWVLLTGDKSLRSLATKEDVECHGVLWVFDKLFNSKLTKTGTLHAGIQALANHPRCRLPKSELHKRIQIYSRNN
jgi:hypothetical protein